MLVKLDDEVLFEIDDRMVKLLAHDLVDPMEEIKRRLHYIINHKCDQCYSRLKDEWTKSSSDEPCKLEKCGIKSIPTSSKELCDLIFSLPEYKNRVQREKESV